VDSWFFPTSRLEYTDESRLQLFAIALFDAVDRLEIVDVEPRP